MQTIIKRINIPLNTRMIAISDIHGHYYHLKNLLEKVNFSRSDILFIVGDIIEKGPFSLKTLRFIMKLSEEYTVYPLIGNVDALRLVIFDNDSAKGCEDLFNYIQYANSHWGSSCFAEMCRESGIEVRSAEDIPSMKDELRIKYKAEFDFLRSFPTIIETQNFIFVHGGIPSDNINQFAGTDAFRYLKYDAFMEKNNHIFSKYVVVGHWPVTLYNDKIPSSNPIINRKQKIISIDGGCGLKQDGQLNALIIPGINFEDFTFESYDDFPVAYAQTPQNGSDDSINIRYPDNKIIILEKGEEFSFVKHKSTGCELWIHNDYILDFLRECGMR